MWCSHAEVCQGGDPVTVVVQVGGHVIMPGEAAETPWHDCWLCQFHKDDGGRGIDMFRNTAIASGPGWKP